MLTTRTPEARTAALEAFRAFRSEGQFVPLSVGSQTVVFPGFDGGAEWGGSAFDPDSGLLYVNANEMAWTGGLATKTPPAAAGRFTSKLRLVSPRRPDGVAAADPVARRHRREADDRPAAHGDSRRRGACPAFRSCRRSARGTGDVFADRRGERAGHDTAAIALKYRFTGYRKFLDPDGYPAIAPPWGTLTAIDLNTGEHAWKRPLGEYPELAAKGMKDTGSENYGGPMVTAGGLVFIAATNFDRKFRAFDKTTGELLWETVLPLSGNATPSTYEADGRQFVVVPAGGGRSRPNTPSESGGIYVAFAIPK